MTPIDVVTARESFESPLVVEYLDGHDWIVREPFSYVSPRVAIHIAAGFHTDFASIPRALWRWMPPTDHRIAKPAVIHDYLYRTPGMAFTRQQADYELREAMACIGTSKFDRSIVYYAVRAGGGRAWQPRLTDG